jgi:GNAT superfamily N-acetyltransferase
MEKNEYQFRLARPDEAGRLREIEDEAGKRFDGLDIFDPSLSSSFPMDELQRLLARAQVWVVCDSNDLAVGMVLASVRCGNGYIEELDVIPEHGRRGLGTQLVEIACSWAREQGCSAVDLSTFRDVPWNGPFYRKLGFRVLEPDEWTTDMPNLRAIEIAQGLVPDARVFMRRLLT